jgi:1,2-phenylacetyl-CoA epoxidase catalytic subunit
MPLSDERILRILESQGYRELVSAHLFATGVALAPSIDDKHMLADHAREELAHFEVVAALYEKIAGRGLYDVVSARASAMPSPASWLEAAVAGYLVDRAASVQLAEYRTFTEPRLEPVIQQILEHEHEHQSAAETALLDQCRGGAAASTSVVAHVERWYPLAVSVLDGAGPDAPRVASVFAESVRATLSACGVTPPSDPRA